MVSGTTVVVQGYNGQWYHSTLVSSTRVQWSSGIYNGQVVRQSVVQLYSLT